MWACPYGSGCTFPLPDEKSGELHCHPSRKKRFDNFQKGVKSKIVKKTQH